MYLPVEFIESAPYKTAAFPAVEEPVTFAEIQAISREHRVLKELTVCTPAVAVYALTAFPRLIVGTALIGVSNDLDTT